MSQLVEITDHFSSGNHYVLPEVPCFLQELAATSGAASKNSPNRGVFALLHASASLLEGKSFDALKVDEICQFADVGRSTFYNHFRNKKEMFVELFQQYDRFLDQSLEIDQSWTHPYQRIAAVCAQKTQLVIKNRTMQFHFVELSSHVTEIAEIWRNRAERSAKNFARIASKQPNEDASATAIENAYLLLSLLSDNVHALYVANRSVFPSDSQPEIETLVERIAILIYQAVYLRAPPARFLNSE